jgi:Amino acid permease
VLTGKAAANYAGSAIILSFVLAGIACAFVGLCYAELAAMIPASGSAYTYAYATVGEIFAWIIGWDLIRYEHLVISPCDARQARGRTPTRGSAKRRALGTQYFKFGIPKAPPLVGVPGAKPLGRFQGRALNSSASSNALACHWAPVTLRPGLCQTAQRAGGKRRRHGERRTTSFHRARE